MKTAAAIVALCAGALSSSACVSHVDDPCTSFVAPVITVTNAATGAPICDATVVYVAGGSNPLAPLSPQAVPDGGPGDCEYVLVQGAGTFTVDVSDTGFEDATASATVTSYACEQSAPLPDRVNILLTPD